MAAARAEDCARDVSWLAAGADRDSSPNSRSALAAGASDEWGPACAGLAAAAGRGSGADAAIKTELWASGRRAGCRAVSTMSIAGGARVTLTEGDAARADRERQQAPGGELGPDSTTGQHPAAARSRGGHTWGGARGGGAAAESRAPDPSGAREQARPDAPRQQHRRQRGSQAAQG